MFVESRSGGDWFVSWPRCSLISLFSAVLRTVLVNCLSRQSGRSQRQALPFVNRTNSAAAAAASADGDSIFYLVTSSTVAILAPPSQSIHSACRAKTPIIEQSSLANLATVMDEFGPNFNIVTPCQSRPDKVFVPNFVSTLESYVVTQSDVLVDRWRPSQEQGQHGRQTTPVCEH